MDQSTTRTALRGLTWAFAAAAFGLAACGPAEREVRVQPAPGESFILTTAEAASIMSTANNAEIQEGQLALQKSQNEQVRQFAQRMISDHSALNQALAEHMRRDGMAGGNPITQQLIANAQESVQNLQQLEGMQFDRAYIQHQVALHQWLLNTLDNALIPGTDDSRIHADMREARDVIASHLQAARQINASMDH